MGERFPAPVRPELVEGQARLRQAQPERRDKQAQPERWEKQAQPERWEKQVQTERWQKQAQTERRDKQVQPERGEGAYPGLARRGSALDLTTESVYTSVHWSQRRPHRFTVQVRDRLTAHRARSGEQSRSTP